jgi:4-amino-4-deoxy-L-arabinose transferase-like glycosyltransferase
MGEGSIGRREVAALMAILVLAAILRFLDLPTRGTWDADQGHDMLVLRGLVRDGAIPLLGPPTSIGDFHHGVLYYYLLAPAAFLSGADPLAVVGFIALLGVVAVAVVWWLARAVGGPVAGLATAGLMAVSASAIEESTFIWNPNLIALSSAIGLAAAWQAWTGGGARWWLAAAGAQAVTMHCHVLGTVMLAPLAGLWLADLRRREPGEARRGAVAAGAAGLALIALSFVPLLVHELQSGFSETRAAADFLLGGSEGEAPGLLVRLLIVPLRVLSWPLTGLVTVQPLAALMAAGGVVAILLWRGWTGTSDRRERSAARWFAATLAWSAFALALGASSLGTVVPGLPNDHYHAFLDPVVFATVGLGVAALWRHERAGRILATAAVAALVALNVAIWPPPVAPDGGYPAAERAARRLLDGVGEEYRLVGLPALKSTDAYGFPLARLGRPPTGSGDLVVACDRLLEPIIGAPCGGEAEASQAGPAAPAERFEASPRTVISIYR